MALAHADVAAATGLRPFNPFRDLRAVASLLVRIFGAEMKLESGGRSRSLAWAIRFPGLAWLWLGFDAWFDTSLYGFVWEEQGRVVANASIAPLPDCGRHWVLSNVAVEPQWRHRGIATALVSAALDCAATHGCTRLLLQVWQGNAAAVRLYERFGFRKTGSICRLRLSPGAALADGGVCRAAAQWRSARPRDLFELSRIADAMTSQDLQSLRRLNARAFESGGLLVWLLEGMRLMRCRPRRVLLRDGRAVGGVALAPASEPARVVVLLRPDEQALAGCVAQEALSVEHGSSEALCDVPGNMTALVEALQAAGAELVDELLHMAVVPARLA